MRKKLTSRQKQSIETKKILYNNSIRLFNKKGYDNVTVDEIVKKSGFSKGTFYTHFNSKNEIIVKRIDELDKYYKNIFSYINKKKTAEEKLKIFINELYKYIEYVIGIDFVKVLYKTQIKYEDNEDVFVTKENRALYEIIFKIIKEGQENGEFSSFIDYHELGILIIRSIRGTFYEWCLYGSDMNLRKEGMTFLRLFLKSIKNIK